MLLYFWSDLVWAQQMSVNNILSLGYAALTGESLGKRAELQMHWDTQNTFTRMLFLFILKLEQFLRHVTVFKHVTIFKM